MSIVSHKIEQKNCGLILFDQPVCVVVVRMALADLKLKRYDLMRAISQSASKIARESLKCERRHLAILSIMFLGGGLWQFEYYDTSVKSDKPLPFTILGEEYFEEHFKEKS